FTLNPALQFLLGVGGSSLQPFITAEKYLTLVALMFVAFGVAFEFPLLIIALLMVGVVNTRQLRHARRYVAVGITIFAAVITPSQDPFSLLFMAIPMYILYELAITVGRVMTRGAHQNPLSPPRPRKPVPRVRSRRELYIAIAAAAAVVGGTVLLVWLLRPGPPGTGAQGTGGLLSRQQRASLLFFITVIALIAVISFLVRRYRGKRVPKPVAIVSSVVVILVLAVIAGFLWPGGLIKHYQSLVKVPDNPITTPTNAPTSSPTVTPGTTGAPASSTPATSGAPSTSPPTTG